MDDVFKPGEAIPTIDQVLAAVSMAEDAVFAEHATNQKLANAWLVLQLAGEKLQELREALENADSPAARSETREEVSATADPVKAAAVVADGMSKLWQAHDIVNLAVHSIGDEIDNGQPAVKQALRAATEIIYASINALEPLSTPDRTEVANV